MRIAAVGLGAIGMAIASLAGAATKEVQFADIPSWVAPPPKPTDSPTPDGAPFRIVYGDNQIRFSANGMEVFQAFRVKVLRPEALDVGNLSVAWNPDAGEVKVHYVRIIRDQQVIDVLKQAAFQVLQREGFLEQAALNGELTAVLQSPGIQVGDEFEYATTVRRMDPTLGDHLFGFAMLPPTGMPGAFRARVLWPKDSKMHWRASADVTGIAPTTSGQQVELDYELRDPRSAVVADGAPNRFNLRRYVEVSDFDSWVDVSKRIWPLFDKASRLAPDSPVRKEIARIAAADKDTTKRMQAALQLVQERIRYVYVGLNGGNFTPASVDETWSRRFGDCKAKTALLLAILKELGIRAEAVMVNSQGGDGLNERLPTPGLFDHVLVRVQSNGTDYWLDGSRFGDKSLALIPPPAFRWVLPLRASGGDLESVPPRKPALPYSIEFIDIDASRGFDEKSQVKVQRVLRGDGAMQARVSLGSMAAEDADRALRGVWRKSYDWVEPDAVSWRFDEQRGTLLLTMAGLGKLTTSGSSSEGRSWDIFGAGFTPPAEYHRPKEQDQTAPWLIDFPVFRCWATSIRLPPPGLKFKWDYASKPVNWRMGGVRYWRVAELRDGVMRTVMSKRSELPEITAAQAEEVNADLPTFDNNISRVFEIDSGDPEREHQVRTWPPFDANTDWTAPDVPCARPEEFAPIPVQSRKP